MKNGAINIGEQKKLSHPDESKFENAMKFFRKSLNLSRPPYLSARHCIQKPVLFRVEFLKNVLWLMMLLLGQRLSFQN